jgi:hypothetical protein
MFHSVTIFTLWNLSLLVSRYFMKMFMQFRTVYGDDNWLNDDKCEMHAIKNDSK